MHASFQAYSLWTACGVDDTQCQQNKCWVFACHADTQLLGELLLDRSNVKVMVRFVCEVQHLMQMMMMLKDSSRSIQFEAFHVFKVSQPVQAAIHHTM